MISSNTAVLGLDLRKPENQLFLLLNFLLLSVAVTTGEGDLRNSKIVMWHELAFVAAYFIVLRRIDHLLLLFKQNRLVAVIILLWIVSITISLLGSPFHLSELTIGRQRYFETLSHLLLFVFLLAFLRQFRLPLEWLLFTMLASMVFVVLQALGIWFFSPEPAVHSHSYWWSFFPFAGHARHMGYNALVVVCIASVFMLFREVRRQTTLLLLFAVMVVLTTLLFWLGGRGAVLFTVCAVTFVCTLATKLHRPVIRGRWLLFGLSAIFAFCLSEWMSVFSFNGLIRSVERTTDVESINQMSSGRLYIWEYSLKAMWEYPWFGLGPQGYLFIPGKLRGTAMPHNAIVQFLVEWGIIGSFLFLCLLGRSFIKGVGNYLRYQSQCHVVTLSCLAVVVGLGLHGLTDGTFYHGKPSFYLAFAWAVYMATLLIPGQLQAELDNKK